MNLSYAEGEKWVANLQGRTLEVALYTVTPTKTTSGTEVSGGIGYTRQALTLNNAATVAGQGIRTSNASDLAFGTATGDWGTITGVAVHDTDDDEIVWYGAVANEMSVITGQPFEIKSGTLTILFK